MTSLSVSFNQNDLAKIIYGFNLWLKSKSYSSSTIRNYISDINAYIIFFRNSKLEIRNSTLKGLSFAITGSLSIPRKTLEDKIISLGGKLSSSVNSNTDYLITNETESSSSKFVNAKKFGTKILSETEFNNLIK